MNEASTAADSGTRPAFELRYPGGEHTAVYSGAGVLAQLGALVLALSPRRPDRVLVCSDEQVIAAQGDAVFAALQDAGIPSVPVTMPAGEEQKSLATVAGIYARFAALAVERGDLVLALGGGVPGDLFGFVAATYLRGLRLVQVPTSLVAQVDSSIGGKVGVDLPEGKNLVGAFKHPQLVVIDYDTLLSLPQDEWVAGTAEAVKHGVIGDAALFARFEADPAGWRNRVVAPAPMLDAAIRVKAQVVQEDVHETGRRMILNYGHTLGHALESAAAYRGLRHGEAVAWGMAMEVRLAVRLGGCSEAFVLRQDRLLRSLGLLRPLPALDADRVYQALFLDKKVRSGRLRWILPHPEPGAVTIRDDVSLDLVRALVRQTVTGTLV